MLIQLYFFKKQEEVFYHVYRSGEILDLGEGPYKIYVYNEEEVFSRYFSYYFQDCPKVKAACKNGFYNMQFIESLFKDYNDCND